MVKGKKEFKSQMQVSGNNKQVDASSTLKDGINLIKSKVKNVKGKKRKILQRHNAALEKKVKSKNTEHRQNSKNSNLSFNYNKDEHECQLGSSNLMLQDLSHYPTLTRDELKMLFIKYKLDGHFEVNENLPSFSVFLDNKSKHSFDTQYLHYNDNKDTYENLYCNNVNENQQNFIDNVYRQEENHINAMCDIGNHFPSNVSDIKSFQYENNNFPYNVQHENFQNISENSQQYNIQPIDQPSNSNVYYDLDTKEWNGNMFLTNRNDNKTSNSEWQYGVKILPEQNNLNTYSQNVNSYILINNENSDYTATTNHDYQQEQGSFLSSFTNVVKHYI